MDRAEIEANDWSLTPGRYVGVAPEAEDENFDFAATLRALHAELDDLDAEAVKLAAKIKENFEKLGIRTWVSESGKAATTSPKR